MQLNFTKYANVNFESGTSLIKDTELNLKKSLLDFVTKNKIKSVFISQNIDISDYEVRINGFRDIDSKSEQISDTMATGTLVGVGLAVKMLNATSTVLILSRYYLVLLDRTAFGNLTHLSIYDIRKIRNIETFKDYQSWDRSTFYFSDGKVLKFGAPNGFGLGRSPNKKIVKMLQKMKILSGPMGQ
jgi:hypothetical protein